MTIPRKWTSNHLRSSRLPVCILWDTIPGTIIRQTETFAKWLHALRDIKGRAVVARRIQRLELGTFGDSKSVGEGVNELRIDFGPGYRVYYTQRGKEIVILLCGGDKSSQRRDIRTAQEMAADL